MQWRCTDAPVPADEDILIRPDVHSAVRCTFSCREREREREREKGVCLYAMAHVRAFQKGVRAHTVHSTRHAAGQGEHCVDSQRRRAVRRRGLVVVNGHDLIVIDCGETFRRVKPAAQRRIQLSMSE
jgi:hypothetical protein